MSSQDISIYRHFYGGESVWEIMHNAFLPPTTHLRHFFLRKALEKDINCAKRFKRIKENANKNPITLYIQKYRKIIKVGKRRDNISLKAGF